MICLVRSKKNGASWPPNTTIALHPDNVPISTLITSENGRLLIHVCDPTLLSSFQGDPSRQYGLFICESDLAKLQQIVHNSEKLSTSLTTIRDSISQVAEPDDPSSKCPQTVLENLSDRSWFKLGQYVWPRTIPQLVHRRRSNRLHLAGKNVKAAYNGQQSFMSTTTALAQFVNSEHVNMALSLVKLGSSTQN